MSGGVHEGGIIQSWLFTSGNQNLVSGKLRRSGFWSYSKFVRWNRVKMAKNGLMAEIFWGASHMIYNNIFNNFSFSTFSLRYFTNPAFWLNFKKIALKTGSRKYQREKVEKQKMLKMLFFTTCEAPSKKFQPFLSHFWPFLPYFIWQIGFMYLQIPELGNLVRTRFWLLLANKSLCSIPKSGARSEI